MTSIIFMGTPTFSVNILKALQTNDKYNVIAVVTQPDRRVGRKQLIAQTPVKEFAVQNNLPVFQPEKLSGSKELTEIIDLQPDLIITAAYGQFLPTKLLNAAKIAAINVHGSLLPKYRGGAPIQYAILEGEKQTGITIMHMAAKMDAGDMIAQASLPILQTDDSGTLFEKLSILGRDLLLETLPAIINQTAKRIVQDETKVTFAYNIEKEQEAIDISQNATQIINHIRALRPQVGAWLMLNGSRTKIWQAQATTTDEQQPGILISKDKADFTISVGQKTALKITQLQPAGKASMSAQAYLNGAGKKMTEGQLIIDTITKKA